MRDRAEAKVRAERALATYQRGEDFVPLTEDERDTVRIKQGVPGLRAKGGPRPKPITVDGEEPEVASMRLVVKLGLAVFNDDRRHTGNRKHPALVCIEDGARVDCKPVHKLTAREREHVVHYPDEGERGVFHGEVYHPPILYAPEGQSERLRTAYEQLQGGPVAEMAAEDVVEPGQIDSAPETEDLYLDQIERGEYPLGMHEAVRSAGREVWDILTTELDRLVQERSPVVAYDDYGAGGERRWIRDLLFTKDPDLGHGLPPRIVALALYAWRRGYLPPGAEEKVAPEFARLVARAKGHEVKRTGRKARDYNGRRIEIDHEDIRSRMKAAGLTAAELSRRVVALLPPNGSKNPARAMRRILDDALSGKRPALAVDVLHAVEAALGEAS